MSKRYGKLSPPEKAFSPVPYFYIVLEPPQVVREFQEKFREAHRKGDGHGASLDIAYKERKQGSKILDWVWYVFPQHENCPGSTSLNDKYGLANREVLWFLADPYLRKNYLKVITELKRHLESGKTLKEIVKDDVKKVISSLTLFEIVANGLHISDFFHIGGLLREPPFFERIINGEPEVADFVTDMKDIADLLGGIWISLEGFEPCEYTRKTLEETMCGTPFVKATEYFISEFYGFGLGEAILHERLTVPSKHFFYWVNNPDPLEKIDAESIEFRNPKIIKEYEKKVRSLPFTPSENFREYKKWPDVETFEKKVETYRWFKTKDEIDGLFNFDSQFIGDEWDSYSDEKMVVATPTPSIDYAKEEEFERFNTKWCILCNEVFHTTFENENRPNHRADRCSACGGSGPFFRKRKLDHLKWWVYEKI